MSVRRTIIIEVEIEGPRIDPGAVRDFVADARGQVDCGEQSWWIVGAELHQPQPELCDECWKADAKLCKACAVDLAAEMAEA